MPISVPITIADRAIDLLAFVEMGEEVVAVALEIVADELGIVAVGDEANALGEERVLDLDLFQADRPLLACDLGQSGNLVDQFALGGAPHGEGELGAERQAVEDRGQREADQGGGERAAENDDDGVIAHEHAQVAAHQHQGRDDGRPGDQAEACCNVHKTRSHQRPGSPNGLAPKLPSPRLRDGYRWDFVAVGGKPDSRSAA